MKVLQTLQKTLSFIIVRDATEKTTFIQKCLSVFNYIWVGSCFFFGIILLILFLFLEAETLQDYSETIYPLVTISIDAVILLIHLSRKSKIFTLIDNLENIIENRK